MPGQAMLYDITIDNKNKSRDITYITVGLYKIITFITPKKTKTVKIELAESRILEIVPKLSKRTFENQLLDIPSETKATSDLSQIIKTKYQLVLWFGAGGWTLKMDCILPIVIGTERFACDEPGYVEPPPCYEEAVETATSSALAEKKAGWTDKLKFWK